MPLYSYRAATREGGIKEGYVEAPNQKAAVQMVRQMGVIPIRVKEPALRKGLAASVRRKKKVDLLTFTTELNALLGAGLPLDRSLQIIADISEHKEARELAEDILSAIREGSSFSEALMRHPQVFPRVYVSMVRAGEAGGVLDTVLDKILEFLESTRQLKESLYSALIYPVLLTITGIASIVVLLTYVIPKFSRVFEDIGQGMPLPTQILLAVSQFFSNYWWIIAGLFLLTLFAFRRYISTDEGRRKWDEMKLRLMGEVLIKLETARFARTLGALLKGGVPLLQALYNVKEVVSNTVIASRLDEVIRGVKEGEGLARPLERLGIFPPLAISMLKVGEETGSLDGMLLKVADTYERELKTALKRFISIIEPALILLMGLLVGFIVISILLAIFSINEIPF